MLCLRALHRPSFLSSHLRVIHSTVVANASPASTSSTTPDAPKKWTPDSIRTGVIARKRGMTSLWNDQGVRVPITVLQLENCQVTANIRTVRRNHTEYHAVQVAASDRPRKTTTRQMSGHFRKAGVPPKRIVKEFPVTPDAHVPVGTTLSAVHFVPGQFVDVIANSIGKGFQGGMKKWDFKGLRASHGVSVSHRSSGSAGNSQDPGRVWPGKKMAGHMGNERITAQNLAVVRVDTSLDLIFVRGNVPGVDDAHVLVRDAKKKMTALSTANQAKAGTTELAHTLPPVVEAPSYRRSPFTPQE